MIRISKETRLTVSEVLSRARAFFGEQGIGLDESAQNPCCLSFEGGGGYVNVSVAEESGRRSVEVEGREWDHQIRTFLGKV